MSTSDRRSGSSGPSKKRDRVFISTAPGGRTADRGRATPAGAPHRHGGREPVRVIERKRAEQPSGAARADELKAARERRQAAQRRSARLRAVAILTATVVIVGGCAAIYTSPLFAVRTIEVVGVRHISASAVRSLAAVPADATLIRFPASEVEQRVSKNPWVASVNVSRVFPSGMRIRVTERVPIAIVDAGKTVWLVDASGMVIARPTAETSETMPVIRDVPGLDPRSGRRTTSEPLLNAINVLTGIDPALARTVRTISAPTVDGAVLIRDDRIEIVVGEAVDLQKKSQLARQILADQAGKVVSIDVRVVDRPTWRGLK